MSLNSLVLGGAGFIGSHLVEALLERGHKVRVFDKIGIKTDNLRSVLKDIEIIEGDFQDQRILETIPKGMDYIFHLVSTTLPGSSNRNPIYDVESNLAPSVKLIEQAVRHNIKKFFFISSGGTIYGITDEDFIPESHPNNPINSYAITKLAVEKYLYLYHHLNKLDYVILRMANPYGPRQPFDKGQGAIAVFINKILNGEPIEIWGDGLQQRDYFYIEDAISAFIATLDKPTLSRIYNFGSGLPASIKNLIETLKETSGEDVKTVYKEARAIDVPRNVLDISLAKKELGWSPKVDLKTGIKTTWEWYKNNFRS